MEHGTMIEPGSFLDRMASIASAEDTVVIFPAGNVEVFGDEDIVMDAEAAKLVIDGFNERGVKIPVDYEHSTLYKAGKGESSPAAGWIVGMAWDATRGLVGTVEWGTEARRQIKAGEYKYLSPHFRIDTETRRVDHVLAVALTNTPRINNMRELVAASVAAANAKTSDGENTMLKKNRVKLCSVLELKDEATDEEIIAQVEEAVEPGEAPAELSEEDQAVMAVKGLLLEIQRSLMEANVIGADASLADAMQAALDLIGKGGEGGEEAAASIAKALGLDGTPKTEDIVAAIHAKTASMVPASALKEVQEKVASLTAERTERRANEIVGSLVEAGKLNPHDESNMKWARALAKSDPDQLASLMEGAPTLYKSDRQTPDASANKTKRATVIASALQDFKSDASGASAKFYVNEALDAEGCEHLTDEDVKTHGIE
jgi:phage I-like protein